MDSRGIELHYGPDDMAIRQFTAQDPTLAELAKKVRTFGRLPDPTGDFQVAFDMMDGDYKGVSLLPDKKTYAVRMSFAGKVRTLAYGPRPSDGKREQQRALPDLCRFRDYCLMRFWKYRGANPVPPDELDYNFKMDEIEQDLFELEEVAPEYWSLLNQIENHFLATGVFREANIEDETAQQERRRAQKKRRTLAVALLDNQIAMDKGFDFIARKLKEQAALIEALTIKVTDLQQHVALIGLNAAPTAPVVIKDISCSKCGNYFPGHATGSGDSCTCPDKPQVPQIYE